MVDNTGDRDAQICPRCGHLVILEDDGTLEWHMATLGKVVLTCPGSYRRPDAFIAKISELGWE